jgi:hypothetical protein
LTESCLQMIYVYLLPFSVTRFFTNGRNIEKSLELKLIFFWEFFYLDTFDFLFNLFLSSLPRFFFQFFYKQIAVSWIFLIWMPWILII